MPLIVDSYYQPYTAISSVLFGDALFKFIDQPVYDPDGMYYTHNEIADQIKYYFNKIYYIEDERIKCVDKIIRKIRYYEIKNGKQIIEREREREIDKRGYLPHLDVQAGERVIFPDEEEE